MRHGLRFTLVAAALTVALLVVLLAALGRWQSVASPGPLSLGHAGLACSACHLKVHQSRARMDAACLSCHRQGGDSRHFVTGANRAHSRAYFVQHKVRRGAGLTPTDCLGCHKGHVHSAAATQRMAFVPRDFCDACHADIRQTGRKDAFDHARADAFPSCSSCHLYHQRLVKNR